ncbi:sugar ABC transporter ATP-binding protein [Mahella australiensis]|uniref:ABC transporter related protein n=1 Tax=Mahella australiensis (strain DSM 15567 / CIP 107919 / 50-1 BON) TaxID=697281 RepID=F3ZVW8_MAHA5|nr:sugar ABC transporter ATP-binding protein [Mahella australiensis]AEE95342.1 ABC transporter related protein [Mahella australiensis 50-1 BON]
MPVNEVLLDVRDIVKRFPGTVALSGVSLEIFKGEIHALVGENGAGKSTLMNIIGGVLQPDEGEIFWNGQKVHFADTRHAQEAGIGFVHQELSLCPDVSVAENIFMGRMPVKAGGMIDYDELYKRSSEILKMLNSNISPKKQLRKLNVGEQQIVEIAKALSLNCKLLILDEPTSSLTENEVEILFRLLRSLKSQDISVLYISHRLQEIFDLCDRVTVLRDGHYIMTRLVSEVTENDLIVSMVGRNIDAMYPDKSEERGQLILKISDLSHADDFKNVEFELYKGEILGFAGLIGAGRSEMARAICGIDPKDSGEVYVYDQKLNISEYGDAIRNGIGYMTEDRKEQGLFLNLEVKKNISAAKLSNIANGIFIDNDREKRLAERFVTSLNIKVSSIEQPVESLSGGNQQKVMLGKWLAIEPRILIMDEPTRGIDVGAKAEIHALMRQLAEQGVGIILISSDMPEIIGMSDRVIVMHEGCISGELSGSNITEENIMTLASGVCQTK